MKNYIRGGFVMVAFIVTVLLMPIVLKITKRSIRLAKVSIDSLFDNIEKKFDKNDN